MCIFSVSVMFWLIATLRLVFCSRTATAGRMGRVPHSASADRLQLFYPSKI